jgi:hypothetical protein
MKLPYLQNDMQQDGCRTNICWRVLLLMITNGRTGQVKFGMEVNCNNLTHCEQNNSSFKLFKHEAMLIQPVSLLYFRCQNNAVRSIHIPWLASSICIVTILFCLDFGVIDVGNSERVTTFSLPQNMQTNSGTHKISYSVKACVISRSKVGGAW